MCWAASYAEDIARGGGRQSASHPALHVHQWHVLDIAVIVLVNASENLHIVSACCLPAVQQRIFQISI